MSVSAVVTLLLVSVCSCYFVSAVVTGVCLSAVVTLCLQLLLVSVSAVATLCLQLLLVSAA